MASFLGAPRILQSLAADRIFPFLTPFAKGSGPTLNPRRGVLLSAGIAYATFAYGHLNLIAPVVSMTRKAAKAAAKAETAAREAEASGVLAEEPEKE